MKRGEMTLAYDLRADRRRIDAVQRATLETDRCGIVPEHGLFGSDQWWAALRDGSLPIQTTEGRISKVYMAGHNDFPEFEVDDGSKKTSWERKGRDDLYVVGRAVRVEYVMTKNRYSFEFSPTTVRIWMANE